MSLPYSITSALCPDLALCNFFEKANKLANNPQKIANWVVNDLQRELSSKKTDDFQLLSINLLLVHRTWLSWLC